MSGALHHISCTSRLIFPAVLGNRSFSSITLEKKEWLWFSYCTPVQMFFALKRDKELKALAENVMLVLINVSRINWSCKQKDMWEVCFTRWIYVSSSERKSFLRSDPWNQQLHTSCKSNICGHAGLYKAALPQKNEMFGPKRARDTNTSTCLLESSRQARVSKEELNRWD